MSGAERHALRWRYGYEPVKTRQVRDQAPADAPSTVAGTGGGDVVTQLDLFGAVISAERQRHVDALTCLRDAVSDALQVVAELRYPRPHDNHSVRASGDWAFCVCRAGLRFESAAEWWSGARSRGETWGWDRTPAHLVTWDELTALVGHDPRRAEVVAWSESLPIPRWKLLTRPHELWPNPGSWHLSYLCHDHVHKQWTVRRRAWQLVLDLLSDAIDGVGTFGVLEQPVYTPTTA